MSFTRKRTPRLALTVVAFMFSAIFAIVPSWSSVGAQESTPTTDLGSLSGEIASDGSSTVGPITQAVAEEFNAVAPDVEISVDISGTGGGFERFCAGETDIQNASRPIEDDEMTACAAAGVDYYEFEVAFDGITVVVNEANDFLTCLTIDELVQLWQAEGRVANWSELNPEYPDEEIALFGPGTDSGTFDYFVEAVLGETPITEDFSPSEDDNVLVEGVSGDENALGYFGYAYYVENEDTLNAVAIDAEGDCSGGGVLPSPETIQDGTYTPLSRPLYVYVSVGSMERPEIQEFIRFYIANAAELASEVGFVASPDDAYASDSEKVEAAIAGEAEPDGPAGAGEATPTS